MTVKRSSLGRNLTALLGQPQAMTRSEEPAQGSLSLTLSCLQPGKYQPRGGMEEAALQELAASIKQQGVLQPLLVREISANQYEIIAGERRWRAAKLAGLTEVPVMLRQVDDETAMAMALVENLQREDLNAMEQAYAMQRLLTEFALSHQQIADLLGKSRTAVSNFLRLLSLSPSVKRLLEHGDIDMGHARAMLALEEEQQHQVAQMVAGRQLSVRETEALVKRIKEGKKKPDSKPELQPLFKERVQRLAERLQARIKIKATASGKGNLTIHYDSLSNLEDILNRFTD